MPADPKPEDWSTLGVAPGCSRAEARAAYLTRATTLHPDRHPDLAGEDRARLDRAMAALNAAWDRIESWPGWDARHDRGDRHDRSSAHGETGDGDRPSAWWWWPPSSESIPAPPPGLRVIPRSSHNPRGGRRDHIELIGESRDLLGLADRADVAYRRLRCTDHPIDAQHLAVAVDALPRLRSVDLDGTGVDDAAVAHLERLPELDDLRLCETRITDAGLASVARLRRLQTLSLADTRITDAGLAHLAGHLTLAVLNIQGTDVRGPGLAGLAECPRLRLLALPDVAGDDRRALAERRPGLDFT